MKKIIITLSLVLTSMFIQAQTVKKDDSGNYVQTSSSSATAKDTGKTFTTAKGEVFKVYETAKGRLFVIRKSKKTGTEYKQYLTVN
jgi:hypothetical protein